MRQSAFGLLAGWLLTASAPSLAATFDVNASFPFTPTPVGAACGLPCDVVLTGTIDVSKAGVVSDPDLRFNVFPHKSFTDLLSIVQEPPSGLSPGTNEWELSVAEKQDPNIFLQLVFTRPLPETLLDFTGADIHGFGALDTANPGFGFAVGTVDTIGRITPVPEPATWMLAAFGLSGLGVLRVLGRNRRRAV